MKNRTISSPVGNYEFDDVLLNCNAIVNGIRINLSESASYKKPLTIKKVDSSSNTISIYTDGDETIDDVNAATPTTISFEGDSIVLKPVALGFAITRNDGDIEGRWASYTPVYSSDAAIPTTWVGNAIFTVIEKTCFFAISATPTAGSDITSLDISLPVAPTDNSLIIPVSAIQKVTTTYSNPIGYIDDSTSVVDFYDLSTFTDGEDCTISISGQYQVEWGDY